MTGAPRQSILMILSQLLLLPVYAFAQPGDLHNPFSNGANSYDVHPGTVHVIPMETGNDLQDAQAPVAPPMRLKDLDEIRQQLNMEPASLAATFFERAAFQGANTAGGFVNGGWTGLVRRFEFDELGRVVLEEYDYVNAGSHVTIPEDAVDSYIEGYPVLFKAFKTDDKGGGHTTITWFTDNKQFRLRIDRALSKSDAVYGEIENAVRTLH